MQKFILFQKVSFWKAKSTPDWQVSLGVRSCHCGPPGAPATSCRWTTSGSSIWRGRRCGSGTRGPTSRTTPTCTPPTPTPRRPFGVAVVHLEFNTAVTTHKPFTLIAIDHSCLSV